MTPKEKAKELYLKFYNYTDCEFYQFQHQYTKECALIAVNEILNVLFQHHKIEYWKQVKQEIEEL